jgi:hypothetical protein
MVSGEIALQGPTALRASRHSSAFIKFVAPGFHKTPWAALNAAWSDQGVRPTRLGSTLSPAQPLCAFVESHEIQLAAISEPRQLFH